MITSGTRCPGRVTLGSGAKCKAIPLARSSRPPARSRVVQQRSSNNLISLTQCTMMPTYSTSTSAGMFRRWFSFLLLAVAFCHPGPAAGQQTVFVVNSYGALYQLDITTCSSVLIGYTGQSFFDIAYCPTTGLLYGVTEFAGLYLINQSTAAATYIGYTGEVLDALVCSDQGVLFAASNDDNSIYQVSTSTGWATNLGSTGIPTTSGGDLTYYNGNLYWSTEDDQLVQVNLQTPWNSIVIGPFNGLSTVYGIVSVLGCTQQVYVSSGSSFYLLNMSTLNATLHCPSVVPGEINGAASFTETATAPVLIPAGPFCQSAPPSALQASPGGGTWAATCGSCINPITGSFNPALAGPGSWTISYTHCAQELTQTVVVQATTATLNPAGPFCVSSQPALLSASSSGGAWTGPGILDAATGVFDPALAGTGTHTITYLPVGLCAVPVSMSIEVQASTAVVIEPAGPFCIDAATSTLVAGTIGGTWSGPGIVSASMGHFEPSAAGAGTHAVTYSLPGNPCPSAGSATIVVEPTPVLTAAAFGPFCLNEGDLPIPSVATDLAGSGLFSVPAGWPSAVALGIGQHEIQFDFTSVNGCSSSVIIPFTVNDTTAINWGPLGHCFNGGVLELSTVVSMAGGDFYLDYGDGSWSGPASAFVPNSLVAYPGLAESYPAQYVYTNALGCTSNNTSFIVVHPAPVPDIFAADVCLGEPIAITDASSIGSGSIAEWDWTVTSQGAFNEPVIGPFYVDSADTVYINLEVTSDQGCSATVIDSVFVHPLPVVAMELNDGCQFSSLAFQDQSTIAWDAVSSWSWSFGDDDSLTEQNPEHSYSEPGQYAVTLNVGSSFGCWSAATETITVWPVPENAILVQPHCFGVTTTLQSLSTVASGVIAQTVWDLDSVLAEGEVVQHLFAEAGFHLVTLTTISDQGCSAQSGAVQEVQPLPQVAFSISDSALCADEMLLLTGASSIDDPYIIASYAWYLEEESLGGGPVVEVMLANSGTYTVGLVVTTGNGCVDSLFMPDAVTVYPRPVAGFDMNPEQLSIVDPEFHVIDGSEGASHWQYTFGDGEATYEQEPTHRYENFGTYVVEQIVSSIHGCLDTSYRTVTVVPDLLIHVPNAFTPNGDGINDVFRPSLDGFDVREYTLTIWNRWGELLFTSSEVSQGWDGTYSGLQAQDDVYVWQIELRAEGFVGKKQLRGHVTVLR